MLVVADTSPLNYLVLIGHISVLNDQVGDVYVPPLVLSELRADRAPAVVRRWASRPPDWLIVRAPETLIEPFGLDGGERAAISLAREIGADRLLIDDGDGRTVAKRQFGLAIVGTLGVIRDAAVEDLLDFETAIAALRATSFRLDEVVLQVVRESLRTARERGTR